MGTRIVIIKLAALGDVLRTTTLLPALQATYPAAHITWVTDAAAVPLLVPGTAIDKVVAFGRESVLWLQAQRFDLLLCLDKEPRATGLAEAVSATDKRGFGLSHYGTLRPLNPEADYAFRLGFDDHLKFRVNQKTYPEIIHEVAGLPYEPAGYVFAPREQDREWAQRRLDTAAQPGGSLNGAPLVGLNPGAGPVYHSKCWAEEHYARLAEMLYDRGIASVLFGGAADRDKLARIRQSCSAPLLDVGCEQDLRQFAGLVASCDLIVTGDTLGMHLAIAQQVPAIVVMGPTCAQEIELYGRGEILSSDYPCSPCYLARCDPARRPEGTPHCLEAITPEQVLAAIHRHRLRGPRIRP